LHITERFRKQSHYFYLLLGTQANLVVSDVMGKLQQALPGESSSRYLYVCYIFTRF